MNGREVLGGESDAELIQSCRCGWKNMVNVWREAALLAADADDMMIELLFTGLVTRSQI